MYKPSVDLKKGVLLSFLGQREGSKNNTGYDGPSLKVGIAAGQYLGFRYVALIFIVSKYRQKRCSCGRCSRNILGSLW